MSAQARLDRDFEWAGLDTRGTCGRRNHHDDSEPGEKDKACGGDWTAATKAK